MLGHSRLAFLAGVALLTLGPAFPASSRVSPTPEINASRESIERVIRGLPIDRTPVTDGAGLAGLAAAERFIAAELAAMAIPVQPHAFAWESPVIRRTLARRAKEPPPAVDPNAPPAAHAVPEPPEFQNLIAELPGRTRPREVLILAAHFDAVAGSPGADDNATGVAAGLEVLRLLRDRQAARTIRVIFFNLEEVGLVGARAYVADHRGRWKPGHADLETIVGMVSLEMLGFYAEAPDSQTLPLPPAALEGLDPEPLTVGDFIAIAGVSRHRAFSQQLAAQLRAGIPAAGPRLRVIAADAFPIAPPDFLRSDHAPFLAAGVPAVMLTDTANFRNPNYHRPTDTIDSLDLDRLTRLVTGLARAAHAIADREPADPEAVPSPK